MPSSVMALKTSLWLTSARMGKVPLKLVASTPRMTPASSSPTSTG